MPGHIDNYVSKQEKELAKDIDRIYRQAAREVRQKLKDFTEHHKAKNALLKKRVKEGTLSEEAYKNWLKGQVFQSEQWKRKLDDIIKVYRNADEKAREIVGGTSKNIFCEAANYTAFSIEKDLMGAISFNLYDKKTVERLIKDNPKMLPEWKINETKDYVWNEKRVQNAVAQGIIQGESIAQIGNRLTGELATSNAKKMNLFARTAFTGAQNAGRIERLHDAEDIGIEVRKKWLASLDNRTRDAHADLDGEEVPVDEPFHSILGDIMYPGDPTADPANVYNCRCTLTYVYPKYQHLQQNHQRYDREARKDIDYVTYREWQRAKQPEPERAEEETVYQTGLAKQKGQQEEPQIEPQTSIEQLRDIAEKATDKYDFWLNLDENQQSVLKASGISLDDTYSMLHTSGQRSEWKEPNPGGPESFAIHHDFSNAEVKFNRITPKTDGWMADADIAGTINIRADGLGDDWDFIIAHEAGHQLSDLSPEIQQMILTNPGDVFGRYNTRLMAFDGAYGEYNPEEAFATCVSNYVRHPDEMKEKYPKAYQAIKELFTASPTALEFVKRIMEQYEKEFR